MVTLGDLLGPLSPYLLRRPDGADALPCPRRTELLGDQRELRSDRLYLGDGRGAAVLEGCSAQPGAVVLLAEGASAPAPAGGVVCSFSCPLPLLFNTVTEVLTSQARAEPTYEPFRIFWGQIMDRQLTGIDEIRESLSRMPHPVGNFVQVAILTFLDGGAHAPYQEVMARLGQLFPKTNLTTYHRKIVLLLSREERAFPRELPNAEAVNALLEEYDAYLAVSNATRNVSRLHFLYDLTKQAGILAHQLGLVDQTSRVYFYEKYSIYSVIDLCAQRFGELYGSDDIIHLIHPAVIHLTRYDREHNTNLRDMLYYYLINDRNLVKTAAFLYMHRNTVINKVNKIAELVDLDLEDGGLRHRIVFSCQVIRYYEKIMHLELRL